METITRDKQVRGLHLREFDYSKSFYLDYTIEGKRRKVKLGELTNNFGWKEARSCDRNTQSNPRNTQATETQYKRGLVIMEWRHRFTKKVSQTRCRDV